jgi:hypothetical protein
MALFILACAPLAFSQDYKRGEFGGGYSANWVDSQGTFSTNPNDNGHDLFNGFYVNGGYNFSRYAGIQAEVAHNRRTTDFQNNIFEPVHLEGQLTQGLIGVKFQDNADDVTVRPFARGLVGVGRASAKATINTQTQSGTIITTSNDDTGFAAVLGGGVAFRVSKHAEVVGSADYNPIHLSDNATVGTGNAWTNNFRVGVGVNFRFGGK